MAAGTSCIASSNEGRCPDSSWMKFISSQYRKYGHGMCARTNQPPHTHVQRAIDNLWFLSICEHHRVHLVLSNTHICVSAHHFKTRSRTVINVAYTVHRDSRCPGHLDDRASQFKLCFAYSYLCPRHWASYRGMYSHALCNCCHRQPEINAYAEDTQNGSTSKLCCLDQHF